MILVRIHADAGHVSELSGGDDSILQRCIRIRSVNNHQIIRPSAGGFFEGPIHPVAGRGAVGMEVETVRGIDDSEAIAASGPQSEARYEPGYRSMHVNDVITSA